MLQILEGPRFANKMDDICSTFDRDGGARESDRLLARTMVDYKVVHAVTTRFTTHIRSDDQLFTCGPGPDGLSA